MKQTTLLSTFALLFSFNIASAQFVVKDENMAANGVSNQGKVVGYQGQAGPYTFGFPTQAM